MQFRKYIESSRSELARAFRDKLRDVPQDPVHHPEGSALIHTRLVRKAIPGAIAELRRLQAGEGRDVLADIDFTISPHEEKLLAMAAWIHDIGKATATTVGGRPWKQGGAGRIQAISHESPEHYLPQLQDLEGFAPEETKQLYHDYADLLNWLIEHHMDFTSGQGFSRRFVAANFNNGRVRNSQQMKLLLILMWADKMGRKPEDTIQQAISKNTDNLLKSAETAKKRDHNTKSRSKPFAGGAEEFAAMLKSREAPVSQRLAAIKNKFGGLSDDEARSLAEAAAEQPTTISADIPVSRDVLVIDQALRQGDPNVQVYAVGGFVRDFLFHKFNRAAGQFQPKDIDITTNLSEDQILERLRTPHAQELGIKTKEKTSVDTFGVVFASVDGGEVMEIAPFRKDVGSADGRRPERVEQAGVREDAMRRDLTMNNLYYDFHNKQILDFNPNGQGIEDIRNGVARPVGDPVERFNEDKLRVLRLVRFFSRFNTGRAIEYLDEQTLHAISQFKDLRRHGITPERIQSEFVAGIKQSRSTASYLQNYVDLGLLPALFPGLHVDVSGISRVGNSKNLNAILGWLLRGNANVGKSLNALKYPRETTEAVQFLIDSLHINSDNSFDLHKRLERGGEQLRQDLAEFARMAGNPRALLHLASYRMPIPGGQELMQRGLKGRAIGDEQRRQGTAHYMQSYEDYLKGQVDPQDEQTPE